MSGTEVVTGPTASGDEASGPILVRPRYSLAEALERLRLAQEQAASIGRTDMRAPAGAIHALEQALSETVQSLSPGEARFLLRPSVAGDRLLVDAITSAEPNGEGYLLIERRAGLERVVARGADAAETAELIRQMVRQELAARQSAAPEQDKGATLAAQTHRGGLPGWLVFLVGALFGAGLLLAYGWVSVGEITTLQ